MVYSNGVMVVLSFSGESRTGWRAPQVNFRCYKRPFVMFPFHRFQASATKTEKPSPFEIALPKKKSD
jgi:hypothetical protein